MHKVDEQTRPYSCIIIQLFGITYHSWHNLGEYLPLPFLTLVSRKTVKSRSLLTGVVVFRDCLLVNVLLASK